MPLSGNDNRDNLLNIPINLQPKKQTNERQFERNFWLDTKRTWLNVSTVQDID